MQLAFYLGTKKENPDHALPFDQLICWWTKSRFSHVEFVEAQQGTFAACWSASQRDNAVRRAYIDLSTGRWVLAQLDADASKALDWFKAHQGQPYDWTGCASFVLPFVKPTPGAWFCSEAVAASAALADTRLPPQALYQLCK